MTGLLVVANANAGGAAGEQLEAGLAALRRRAEVEVCDSGDTHGLDAAIDALGDRRLVVAGGDGSLHLAVQELLRRGPGVLAEQVLGLLPLGTGNDFARGIGYPLDPEAAAERCVSPRARTFDLLTTDAGWVVVNASHAGLGAQAAAASEDLKPRLGALAYPVGALLSGVRERGTRLRVEVDGRVVSDGDTLMVGVGNGPSIGGGTALLPGADPGDGLLDVVVIAAVGPVARAAFGAALSRGEHLERDDVTHLRGREARISGEPVRHDPDGEVTDPLAAVTYTLRPAAWHLAGA